MATLSNNLFLQGARGMLGKQLVYKKVGNQMIVTTRPTRTKVISEVQKKHNMRFKYATIYAKAAIMDDVLGPIYAEATKRLKRFSNPYLLAVTDYLRSPEIGDIQFGGTTTGSQVLVEAFEDPLLAKVQVSVLGADDSVVESGEAALTSNGIQWQFTLPTDIPEDGKLEVRSYDLPGNVSTKVFEI